MALNILAVSAEAYPLAKTGGLGDAVSGLCRSVDSIGARVTLMLPAYRGVLTHLRHVRALARLEGLPGGTGVLLRGDCPELGLPVLLLQNDALFDREGLYLDESGAEYGDNAPRFAALAQAAARVAAGIDGVQRPDIVHAHDWHAGLVPLYMRQLNVTDVKTILTLHNIAFQGLFPLGAAAALGIEPQYCTSQGAEFWGQLNFLKAGIRYADLITVVSQNYAREILTPQFGCGLENVLRERADDLISIANGIDTTLWDPQNDPYLPGYSFSADRLGEKAECKRVLQRCFGLEQNGTATILAMGSRLTAQKMADVAAIAIPRALDAHPQLQVCVIGQGEKQLESALQRLQVRYTGRCGIHIGFQEREAHLMHAGADILLHGSRFEPFGLTPLYSMRYGTIPIGSRVGGMVDTINDPGERRPTAEMSRASGILFDGDHPDAMTQVIDRAMALRTMPGIWHAMQRNAMTADFSWARTAPSYLRAYQSLRPDVALDQIPERRRSVPISRTARANVALALTSAHASEAHAKAVGRRSSNGVRGDTLVSPREASAA